MSKKDQKIKELETEISRLKSSVAELKVLNEIAVSSGEATDIDQVLNLIVQKSIMAIDAEQGSIHLLTKNKKEPFITIIRQDDRNTLRHNYRIGTNITGWVLQNRKSLIIENLSEDKRFKPTEEEKKDIHSVLCVPIWSEGDLIGLMMLINKKNQKEFSQNDLTLFSIISVQAGQLIKNLELQRETYQKRKEAEKLLELDKIKTNFFTNISHEFRTPLTLILGPAKKILENAADTKIKEDADLIYRSAGKLNRLVDQLLDISSIEAGKMKLKTSPQKLFPVIKHIVSSFQSFAERKKISLTLDIPREEITLYLDIDKIDKILSNILSNALKFTPEKGKVNVVISVTGSSSIEPEMLPIQKKSEEAPVIDSVEISVSDTGIGIPEEQLDKIFDRFYQIDNKLSKEYEGTGIGLSLTKELVNLHKGKISVESREGKGSTFRITIPLGNKHLLPEEIVEEISVSDNKYEENEEPVFQFPALNQSSRQKKESLLKKIVENSSGDNIEEEVPSLLIIDDNTDVRKYIAEILSGFYNIVEASNGEEGLRKSFEEIPDLIISDIMMPKIDGIELCRQLKSDARTSHIPVILLTAKATLNDKLEGLETGADDYIMKPFEAEELKARIKNLLEQRKRIHEYFQRHEIFEVKEKGVTNVDKKFLQKVLELINENIENPGFSIDYFADNLAISRSLLHKKLIALVGESPGELVKRIRLNKAAKLIENNSGNVTEVAFEVGFNDPSYFAVCFKKQFGVSPSHFKKAAN